MPEVAKELVLRAFSCVCRLPFVRGRVTVGTWFLRLLRPGPRPVPYRVGRYTLQLDLGCPQLRLVFFGAYERPESAFVRRSLAPGAVAIDVGANVGYFSALMASRVGGDGKVYALDPAGAVWPHLEALQRDSQGIVQARRLAVVGPGGESRRQARFFVDPANHSWSTTVVEFAAKGVQPDLVAATSLDRFVHDEKIDRLDFLKIDVEGAEMAVLRGLEILCRRGMRPVVLCEFRFEKGSGSDAVSLLALAGACGYALMVLRRGGRLRPAQPEWVARLRGVVNLVLYPVERLG